MNDKLFSLIKEKKIKLFKKIVTDHIRSNLAIDLNIRDTGNNYLLYYSILSNDKDTMEFIIENGARIDITDENNRSILFTPIRYGYNDIVDILLKFNKNLIGVDITDILDNNGNTPLFYTIVYKKIDLMNTLLQNNINININNNKGLSPLHYTVLINSEDMMKILINKNADINNVSTVTGETPLHLAVNLKYDNITKYLLQNNANPNIKDFDNKMTSLHYSVINNPNVFKYLINTNTDINAQDIFGNTIFHYAIDNMFMDAFVLADNNKINFDIANNHHKLLAHKIIEMGMHNKYYNISETILIKSDASFQDINGNTILHLLFKLENWKDIFIKLTRKVNIIVFNKEGKTPYDYINNDTDKLFVLNHIVTKFIQNNSIIYNICKNEYNDKTKKHIIDLFSKYYFNNSPDNWNTLFEKCNDCKDLISQIFLYFINNNPKTKCFPKTYKLTTNNPCVKLITNNTDVNVCTYTGSTLDIIFGIVYLLQKYNNIIIPIDKQFKTNKKIVNIYNNLGFKVNEDYEFLNFEIIWINKIIVYPKNFDTIFTFAYEFSKKNNIEFIAIPLGIELNNKNHANYLLFDIKKKSLERFEPNGSIPPYNMDYNEDLLDDILISKFSGLVSDINYIRPKDYLPQIGFQRFDSIYKDVIIGDPGGFCTLWSLYYIEVRILNSKKRRNSIINNIFRTIKTYNTSFKSIIRNYSKFITDKRDKCLHKANMNINMWINEKYDTNKISEFYKIVEDELFSNIYLAST